MARGLGGGEDVGGAYVLLKDMLDLEATKKARTFTVRPGIDLALDKSATKPSLFRLLDGKLFAEKRLLRSLGGLLKSVAVEELAKVLASLSIHCHCRH